MKVFVAGATGVLGRRAVAALVDAGHDVTAVARGPEKADLVRRLGATPVTVDLFDADAVRDAADGHEAVVNLATKIPPLRKAALMSAWEENDRIRSEASHNLAHAAVATGAEVFVQESIAFVYGDRGDEWIDEDEPLWDSPFTEALRAADAAAQSVTDAGARGIVLRFGFFMAADSDQMALTLHGGRTGLFLMPGDDDARSPLIHIDDAATAVVEALDAPAGVYHVVDDEPATRADQRAALAQAVGRRRLLRPPSLVTRLMRSRAPQLVWSQRPSNARFKEATGWAPVHADAASAYEALARDLRIPKRLPGLVWVALALLAFTGLSVGVQALADPRGFFGDFPFGREWVASDGPFNLHLLRDFAALNLGIGALALVALVGRSRVLTRAAGLTWLLYGVPHLVYHALNREVTGVDLAANLTSLAVFVVAAVVALVAAVPQPVALPVRRRSRPTPPEGGADGPGGRGGTSRRRTPADRAGSA